jgi:uncharacterized protein
MSVAIDPAPTLKQRLAVRERPNERPVMYQSWRELLFLHWPCPASTIQAMLPRGLTVDTYDGQAWVGVVPFLMRNIRPRWSPSIPGISNFLELNLRTYVYDRHGTPGVWFFSLDANQRFGVWWGRTFYHLPYRSARMQARIDVRSRHVSFQSERRDAQPRLTCRYEYQPVGSERRAVPGSFEFFLIERYILFAHSPVGRLYSGQVHHPPYEISDVDLRHWDEHLLELGGLPLPGRRPEHAVVSKGVDVDVFRLRPV